MLRESCIKARFLLEGDSQFHRRERETLQSAAATLDNMGNETGTGRDSGVVLSGFCGRVFSHVIGVRQERVTLDFLLMQGLMFTQFLRSMQTLMRLKFFINLD